MKRKADIRGGNGDIIFNNENGTAKKYLRNISSFEKISRFKKELQVLQKIKDQNINNIF
ncbi:hypothetical protein [Lactobacillus intestinalis]|uniref:hypothetical protein n=1 Tax=Lactobacillus intestinalis TaxID=151781 RepID=UPI0025B2F3BC|nr:hypothetical protein [Lactobacillus intestinalis]